MTNENPNKEKPDQSEPNSANKTEQESGGFGEKGNGKPEPTRYNDWEVDGRCSDF